ncbi:hypothetical protein CXB51_020805 [Gossypium anomalum]|uniref:Uncharacterized protein n=1 Tax=Gossypium anomalum TaxID=47600 RepID=A0A8J5YN95_9ROSI|nr:hypothetical protein CXB51_020805 [Gossypium anomalum]
MLLLLLRNQPLQKWPRKVGKSRPLQNPRLKNQLLFEPRLDPLGFLKLPRFLLLWDSSLELNRLPVLKLLSRSGSISNPKTSRIPITGRRSFAMRSLRPFLMEKIR